MVKEFLKSAAESALGVHRNPRSAALAEMIARPLVPEGKKRAEPSDPEVLALIHSRIARCKEFCKKDDEYSPIAAEYASALRTFLGLIDQAPGPQPLVQAGPATLKGSLDDQRGAFFLGLLGIGTELNTLSAYGDKLTMIHTRLVACRLRLAELAVKECERRSTGEIAMFEFSEMGHLGSTVNEDTLKVRNVSGTRLSHVMVLTDLTGKAGENFKNMFYVDAWEPDQTLQAVCPSGPMGRETVRGVSQVRVRVISDEKASGWIESKATR